MKQKLVQAFGGAAIGAVVGYAYFWLGTRRGITCINCTEPWPAILFCGFLFGLAGILSK